MKAFAQVKVQRALAALKISDHPLFMPFEYKPGDSPMSHEINIQLRQDLPRNQQPAPLTKRNGSIYMISRDAPAHSVRPGNVLLLDLKRAAQVLADDTYTIATQADVDQEMKRQDEYRKEMVERDRQLRMQNQSIENNITVQQPAQQQPIQIILPEGYMLTPMARRRGKAKSKTAVEGTAAPEE